jgi:L-iditol 2-dehydrogenase
MQKMHAIAKTSRVRGALDVVQREKPTPGLNEVLVEIKYAGLCGSDAGIYQFKPAFERMNLPTVIGHEYAGRVVACGSNVTAHEIGDIVVERPIRPCGECYQCRIGKVNICQNAELTGIDFDGAYQRYIAVPSGNLHTVPEGVDPKHAAIVEPTAVAARTVIENSRISPGDRVLVEGPGPIGLLAGQIAKTQGAEVIISGIHSDKKYRLPLAREFGFETLNIAEEDMTKRTEDFTDDVGYDVVVDATGHPSGIKTAVEQVQKGGQVVLIALTGETTMSYTPVVRSEIDIQCSYGAVYEDFERALRLIASGDVDAMTFVDDRYSLLDVEGAFEDFLAGVTVKPVFDISELNT